MVEDLKTRYQGLSDQRLREIVLHPADYRPEALQIAEECLRERGLPTTGPEPDWTDIRLEHEEDQSDTRQASPALKFIFFFIPGIGLVVIFYWLFAAIKQKTDPRIAQTLPATLFGLLFWGTIRLLLAMLTSEGQYGHY
jgi:hypothetical protein